MTSMYDELPGIAKMEDGSTEYPNNDTQKSYETHSNGVSGVGFMVTSTRHHRLEGGDAIPIRE